MTAVVNKELNSIVECCICTETFTDPRMLPCIHTFCVKCLTKTGSRAKKGPGDKMPCPLCRIEFTIPTGGFTGLQKNFFMNKVVEAVQLPSKQQTCDSNTENCSAVKWYCDECKQKLCDECFTKHKKILHKERHVLVPFGDQTTDKSVIDFCTSTFCDRHEKEELKLFCNDCHVVLCALCFIESHQPHKWSYVTTVAKEFKSEIENNISIISGYVPEALSVLEELEKKNIKFLDTVSKVESEVNKKKLTVKALLDELVEENASSLRLRLTSLKHATLKQKEIEREEIDRHMTELDSYIMSFNEIVTRGSDADICRSVRESNNRVKDFKKLHRTVMEKKSPVFDISFAERKSEDFLETFGNLLGKIEGADQDMAKSHHQQQPIMFSQKNPQMLMPGMQYMRYMVQQSPMMSAQSLPPPQQMAAIRQGSDESELCKKLRGILNKITPSTFEKLLTQITDLPIDNENRLSGCVAVIFEKAISEPKFVKEYSNLAQRMMSISVPSTDNPAVKVTFRKLLLNRCQEEFERDQQDEQDIIQRQKEIEATTTEDKKKRLIEEKNELVSRSLKRSLGNIRFIGELFKQKMLTEKTMHDCIKKLLDAEDEDSLELLCNLLKTIGKESDTEKAKKLMDSYFVRLGDKQGSVPSRIRFMIKDLLELRKNKWIPRRVENIPKTIVEIHKEANEENEMAKLQLLNRGPPPPKPRPDRRLPDSSSTEKPGDDGWTMAVSSNTKNRIDKSKMMQIAKNKKVDVVLSLKPQWQMGIGGLGSRGSSQEAEKQPSMPSNRFSALENLGAGRKTSENFAPQRFSEFSSIGRRVSSQERSSSQELRRDNSPHGAVQRTSSPLTLPVPIKDTRKEQPAAKEELSREVLEHKAESLLEEYLHLQDLREAVTCVKELESPKSLHLFVSFAINYVLEKKELARIHTGTLLHQLMTEGVLSFEQCELGFKEVLQEAESLAVDIPKVWEYLGEIVAGTIKDNEKMWQLLKTGCQELAANRRDVLFRKTMAVAAHKLGADRASMALRRSGMRWSDYVNSGLFSYTKQNNLEQLDPVREELIALLKQHSDNQPIFEWIQRNVTVAEAETREFIRALVTAVCTRAILASETSSNALSASYSVSEAEIVSRQTLLQRYLDHKPDREIQALYALQALVHSLEHPSNILHSFFNILYDKDIIAEDAFWEWQNSTDPAEQTGKGVAYQSVRPFFDWLGEGTEETTGS